MFISLFCAQKAFLVVYICKCKQKDSLFKSDEKNVFFEAMNNLLGRDVYIISNLFKKRILLKHF